MNNLLRQWLHYHWKNSKAKAKNSDSGFTMLEVVTVVIVIGILSAIAAPAWDAFVQRQRIRAMNNQILSVLQSAQTRARGNKESVSVVFNVDDSPLKYKVYPTDQTNNDDPDLVNNFPSETLNIDGKINEDKITLSVLAQDDTDDFIINFNDQGAVSEDQSFPISVTIIRDEQADTQRCVVIQTLLGSMRVDEGEYNQNKGTGCQTE